MVKSWRFHCIFFFFTNSIILQLVVGAYVGVFQGLADPVGVAVGDPAFGHQTFGGAVHTEHVQRVVDSLSIINNRVDINNIPEGETKKKKKEETEVLRIQHQLLFN